MRADCAVKLQVVALQHCCSYKPRLPEGDAPVEEEQVSFTVCHIVMRGKVLEHSLF